MSNEEGNAPRRRGFAARAGICLLNLWQPGLGLIRLRRYRAGFVAFAAILTLIAGIPAFYAATAQPTYARYVALLAVVLVILILAYGGAIVLSWRWSRDILPRKGRLWRWYGVVGLGVAASAVWLLLPSARSYYKPYRAASQAMAPTLLPKDRLIARMHDLPAPRRGDVVIVRAGEDDYVTRLAGVPGDRIAMVGGSVVLNGKAIAQRPSGNWAHNTVPYRGPLQRFSEQFPGEAVPHHVLDSGATPQDEMAEVVLGPDAYFVLGDNRDNSLDSRFPAPFAPGVVSRDRILGRALFRWWRADAGLENGPL